MSADRFEITEDAWGEPLINGSRAIMWSDTALIGAIRQQARDIAELRADYVLKCTEYNDTTEFARGLIAERDELRGEIARHERNNTHIGKMFDQLRADLAAAVAARANMETDLELARRDAGRYLAIKPHVSPGLVTHIYEDGSRLTFTEWSFAGVLAGAFRGDTLDEAIDASPWLRKDAARAGNGGGV